MQPAGHAVLGVPKQGGLRGTSVHRLQYNSASTVAQLAMAVLLPCFDIWYACCAVVSNTLYPRMMLSHCDSTLDGIGGWFHAYRRVHSTVPYMGQRCGESRQPLDMLVG